MLPVSVQSIAVSIMQMTVHKVIFFIFIPASLVGFFTLLIMTGPKSIDYESLDTRLVSPEESKVLKEKSMKLEGTFDDLYALDQLEREIKRFKTHIQNKDSKSIHEALKDGQSIRKKIEEAQQ